MENKCWICGRTAKEVHEIDTSGCPEEEVLTTINQNVVDKEYKGKVFLCIICDGLMSNLFHRDLKGHLNQVNEMY